MSNNRNHSHPVGALFCPTKTVVKRNSGYLEISGWCRRSYVDDGFLLAIKVGKRIVDFPLAVIEMSHGYRRYDRIEGTATGGGSLFFFHTEIKIGKGLKRLDFAITHPDGRSEFIDTRMIWQANRMEHGPVRVSPKNEGELTDYEAWLQVHEPLLRSANDFESNDKELVFPVPMAWVIELKQGKLSDLLQTIHSLDRGSLGPCTFVLLDEGGFFEGKLGEHDRSVLMATGSVVCSSGLAINQVLGSLGADVWVGFVKAGDVVESHLQGDFFRYLARHPEVELFYTDFDHLQAEGRVGDPQVLPAWNRDLLNCSPYVGESFLIKNEALLRIGGLGRERYYQKWALLLKFSRQCTREQVGRLCGIYFHLLEKPHVKVDGDDEAVREGTELLQSHHDALGCFAEVTVAPGSRGWRVRHRLPAQVPLVSLLIPTRDGVSVLKTTVDSILDKTDYPHFEILILDNDSVEQETLDYFEALKRKGCRVVSCPGKFNYSQINNRGSMEASGEIIGFLNNDLEVIEPGWLTEMVSHACRKEIGAVGAKLLYPDKSLQHAGVLIGVGHVAAHAFRLSENDPETGPSRAHLMQNYSAVTAACLLVRAEVFKEVGGFDDLNLAITNNDVDLCIKIREAGYRNLYTPFATLYHHESATRGPEDTPEKFDRYQKEVNYMWKQWAELLMNDPSYNRLLTRFKEDFSLAGKEELDHYIPGKIF